MDDILDIDRIIHQTADASHQLSLEFNKTLCQIVHQVRLATTLEYLQYHY